MPMPGDAAEGQARRYAGRVLADLGFPAGLDATESFDHPAISWVRSGLAQLTGHRGGQPLMAPIGISAAADGALAALRAVAAPKFVQPGALAGLRGSALLGQRGRLAGLSRNGSVCAGQGTRLMRTRDGVIAASLVRQSDWESIPAWLGEDIDCDWRAVTQALRSRSTADCLAQGRLLGLAVADANTDGGAPDADSSGLSGESRWLETICVGPQRLVPPQSAPLVVDLSSLWAGPLCTQLLGRLGARVIKVESARRPDGARAGNASFYEQLNDNKSSVALDLTNATDRAALVRLIDIADIVVESSRPRALRQLGIDAGQIVRRRPGLTWIAISAHGRQEPEADWIGFGDDAGVAAGLSRLMREVYGQWVFCGDAIADPLTGLHAALVAWASWMRGKSVLQSLSLRGVTESVIASEGTLDPPERRARTARWTRKADGFDVQLYDLPRTRGPAQSLGESNELVLKGILTC
jgi:hypothetical protein